MTYEYYKTLIGEYINLGRSSERLLGEIGFPAEIDLDADGLVLSVNIIAAAADGDMDQLLDLSDLKSTAFAQKFQLPYQTMQDWCSKKRTPPEYLPMLVGYILISERTGKLMDLTGKTFWQLTVIEMLPERQCLCRCSCGNDTITYRSNLINGQTKSCGCLKYKSRIGTKQGNLLLIEWYKGDDGRPRYRCRCDCGREVSIRADSPTQSCGKCGAFAEKQAQAVRESGDFVEGTQLSKLRSTPTAANKSGVVGVFWNKSRGKWSANIRFKGHRYYLGHFEHIQDAIDAREKAEKELFGELLKRHGK